MAMVIIKLNFSLSLYPHDVAYPSVFVGIDFLISEKFHS